MIRARWLAKDSPRALVAGACKLVKTNESGPQRRSSACSINVGAIFDNADVLQDVVSCSRLLLPAGRNTASQLLAVHLVAVGHVYAG